jgi:hypothetical protein
MATMQTRLPLPALPRPSSTFQLRGERAGVRGSLALQALSLGLPLTLTLSAQAGRGNPRSAFGAEVP